MESFYHSHVVSAPPNLRLISTRVEQDWGRTTFRASARWEADVVAIAVTPDGRPVPITNNDVAAGYKTWDSLGDSDDGRTRTNTYCIAAEKVEDAVAEALDRALSKFMPPQRDDYRVIGNSANWSLEYVPSD
ncbi:hypothetical protein [Branchiibius sp. NY16-3462-2]|uniref:hypothetical protein n=1 Tax=Branchiibius sp. NY16-3462-2 TaxID=1807500 RepID=UPI000791299D|nr:hypothetical protein [Branchiibius sp. NY16-3462-2]KYH43235.1 hypothetical protein AZH51_12840 [Branchiibius sp. NY16-3462-2]